MAAKILGDRTAEVMGRLTLNPLAHADLIGTFILPIISIFTGIPLFGWAKPVPVDPRNLRSPTRDMFWIASAGPLSNIFLAVLASLIFSAIFVLQPESLAMFQYVLSPSSYEAGQYQRDYPTLFLSLRMLFMFVQINVVLAIFNLIPIHPLDGGKILARFIPVSWNRFLEDNQQMLSMGLLILFMSGLNFLSTPVFKTVFFLVGFAERLAFAIAGN